jgi:hypothetical protein
VVYEDEGRGGDEELLKSAGLPNEKHTYREKAINFINNYF